MIFFLKRFRFWQRECAICRVYNTNVRSIAKISLINYFWSATNWAKLIGGVDKIQMRQISIESSSYVNKRECENNNVWRKISTLEYSVSYRRLSIEITATAIRFFLYWMDVYILTSKFSSILIISANEGLFAGAPLKQLLRRAFSSGWQLSGNSSLAPSCVTIDTTLNGNTPSNGLSSVIHSLVVSSNPKFKNYHSTTPKLQMSAFSLSKLVSWYKYKIYIVLLIALLVPSIAEFPLESWLQLILSLLIFRNQKPSCEFSMSFIPCSSIRSLLVDCDFSNP